MAYRSRFTKAEQEEIAFQSTHPDMTAADLAKKYNIAKSTITRWRRDALLKMHAARLEEGSVSLADDELVSLISCVDDVINVTSELKGRLIAIRRRPGLVAVNES